MKLKTKIFTVISVITVSLIAQAAFAGASKLFKAQCAEHYPITGLHENVKIKSFIENIIDKDGPNVLIQDTEGHVFKIKIDRYDLSKDTNEDLLQALRDTHLKENTLNFCVNVKVQPNEVWGVELNSPGL